MGAEAVRWTGVVCAGVVLLAGCTTSTVPGPDRTRTRTSIVTRTRPAPKPHFHPPRPRAVAPLPYGHATPAGQRDGRCPYIYRTTLLTRDRPVGCRFYFYAPPYEAIADIVPRRLPSARAAHDAMVLTARTGRELVPEPHFAPGLSGICYRTRFFRPDGDRDWAFVFSKGRLLVVVHTQRSDTSRNALYIGRAIAPRI